MRPYHVRDLSRTFQIIPDAHPIGLLFSGNILVVAPLLGTHVIHVTRYPRAVALLSPYAPSRGAVMLSTWMALIVCSAALRGILLRMCF